MASKFQLSLLLPEGKRTIKKQLYSGPFTSREAVAFIFLALMVRTLICLYFAHSCTERPPLPSASEATPHAKGRHNHGLWHNTYG